MMHDYLTEPHEISIGERNRLSELVEHQVMLVHAKDRYAGLRRMLDASPGLYGIIFCRTKADTIMVADRLSNDGFNIDALHGDLLHEEREVVMKKFRTRQIKLLAATDVAARGLHINDLSHVIHYSIPEDQNTYTHRSGRTGRAGKTGSSLVIVHAREKFKLERIEKILGQEFKSYAIPTCGTIARIQLQQLLRQADPIEASVEEISATLDSVEGLDPVALKKTRKTIEFYRVSPELSTTPEKVKPKPKKAGSITGREAREKHVPREMTAGMIELVVNLGKRNELTAERLGELINGCGQVVKLGRINIVDMQTYFEVPYPLSNEIINHFKQTPTEFCGRPVNLAFAGNARPAEPKNEKSRNGKRPFGRKKNY